MFSARLNVSLRSSKAGVRSCIANSNNRRTFRRIEKSTASKRDKTIVNDRCEKNFIAGFRSLNFHASFKRPSTITTTTTTTTSFADVESSRTVQFQSARTYASDCAPKKANVFGELGDRQFEKFPLDEDEKKEEKFVENEARVNRRYRLFPSNYGNLIKSHIQKGDLTSALGVLDLIAENRDKPTTYMYNLLLRAYAVVGDFKKSRSLYIKMKKIGLEYNAATYTCILNACANYHHTETAIEYLNELRQEFAEKNIVLNETHYNAMIKAYGRHGKIIEAFAIADEMRDKRMSTNEVTFNSLLISTISDRDAGLRHALVLWHAMRRHAIKPTTTTYNLMLRAMRDTKLGDLKINDVLISSSPQCQISLDDNSKPDLLADRPCVNSLTLSELTKRNRIVDENPEVIDKDNLPAKIDTTFGDKSLTIASTELLATPLEKYRKQNRLILFGGITGILERMKNDGVKPDAKTITLLMELVPNTSSAENSVIDIARSTKIPLDIDFFNMLMKKRSLRRDYAGAKEVLDDIQRSGLSPDIITWGILALGCETSADARNLIDGMKATGHRLNVVIAGTLINIACRKIRFGYILEMMELMVSHQIKPNWELYACLDNFQVEMKEMIASKKFTRTVNNPAFKIGFSKFNLRYGTWQKEMERKVEKKDKKTLKDKKR